MQNSVYKKSQIESELGVVQAQKVADMAAERRAAEKKEMLENPRANMELDSLEGVAEVSSARNWIFAGPLGGGMAVASLWVELDGNNVVRDRIVRKDAQMSEEHWQGSQYWHVDPHHPNRREPLEYYCQRLVQGPENAPNRTIVQARKCELDDANRIYRLYTEYCPHGDLNNLIIQNNHSLAKIPEAWIWMAFSELVDAGLAMEKANAPVQVVHRDLKPANIFLDLPSEDSWPRYPRVRVGDFGLAVVTAPSDGENPHRWGMAGTKNYFAPEQELLDRRRPRPDTLPQLLAWTNVWGVGRVMLDAVNQTPHFGPRIPVYSQNGQCHKSSFRAEVLEQYSSVLLRTIMACLATPVTKRPTFARLRTAIDRVISPYGIPLSERSTKFKVYMEDARKGFQKEDPEHDLHGLSDEQYKVDMAFQNLKSAKSGAAASARAASSYR